MNAKYEDKNLELIKEYGDHSVVKKENEKDFLSKMLDIFDILDVRALWHIVTHLKCAQKVFNAADVAIIVGAVAYVIVPFDAIPDWLPIIGQLDDAGVIQFILQRYDTKISEYKEECMQ
ncbi:MAG: hypothetical protein APR54_06370 [Candidatus Cloacimonas sp. SDB]|nr:MAG: hypothetical protein APR54_06370 [Candidatus Cloacimonas sp. SDB]